MILANVIWAPNWPFWYWWFPFAAFVGFAAELFTFHFYQRRLLHFGRSLLLVSIANLVSYIGGFIILGVIASAFPDRDFLIPQPLGFPPWQRYHVILWQFVLAFLLSIAIEFCVYRFASRRRALHRLAAVTFLSNLAGYTVIALGYIRLWLPSTP